LQHCEGRPGDPAGLRVFIDWVATSALSGLSFKNRKAFVEFVQKTVLAAFFALA
jgi:hypothetical protein